MNESTLVFRTFHFMWSGSAGAWKLNDIKDLEEWCSGLVKTSQVPQIQSLSHAVFGSGEFPGEILAAVQFRVLPFQVSLILTLSGFASCLTSVPGIPGQDYPTLDFYNLPDTSFECGGRVNAGWEQFHRRFVFLISSLRFYSDEEAFCQMYHMCVAESSGSFKKFSFLCPNGQ